MSKTDRRVFIICLLICLISLPLFFEQIFLSVFGFSNNQSGETVGIIKKIENDVRLKDRSTLGWQGLQNRETQVKLGSSLFSGQGSSVKIELQNGAQLIIGENSLIQFRNRDQFLIPDLKFGSLSVISSKPLELNINGKKVIIPASKNPTQLSYNNSGLQVKNLEKIIETKPQLEQKISGLLPSEQKFEFDTELDDLYMRSAANPAVYLLKNTNKIERSIYFSWQTQNKPTSQEVRHSASIDFSQSQSYLLREQTQLRIDTLFLGPNYWQVYADQNTSSSIQSFEVKLKEFKTNLVPQIAFKSQLENRSLVLMLPTDLKLKITGRPHPEIAAILVHVASENGTDNNWAALFKPDAEIEIPVIESGLVVLQVREILKDRRLSALSQSLVLDIHKPPLPAPPILQADKKILTENENSFFSWNKISSDTNYEIEIVDLSNENRKIIQQKDSNMNFHSKEAGDFTLRVRRTDLWGQRSAWSDPIDIGVRKPLLVQEKPAEQKLETRVAQKQPPPPPYLNRKYDDNAFSITVSGYVTTSTQQKFTSQQTALGGLLGLQLRYQLLPKQSLEGFTRVKTVGLNSATHDSISLFDIRYFYRFDYTPIKSWHWLPFFSLGAGLESYRAAGKNIYVNSYDLAKVGLRMNFPYLRRWTMGGDLFYGQAADSSTKLEVTGNFGYYFDQKFSAGLGYRVFFFEALSKATSPAGTLPYREAYGEGYSTLRYHF